MSIARHRIGRDDGVPALPAGELARLGHDGRDVRGGVLVGALRDVGGGLRSELRLLALALRRARWRRVRAPRAAGRG